MEERQQLLRPKAKYLAKEHALVSFGFGACRAWIVVCLTSSTVFVAANDTSWIYLTMGAISAALVSLAAEKKLSVRIVDYLQNPAAILAIVSAIMIPSAYVLQSPSLSLAGFMAGGASAGLLQVLWGRQFASFDTRGAMFCSATAAIATALLIALLPATAIVGYIAFPLVSFLLLEATQRSSPFADEHRNEKRAIDNKAEERITPDQSPCVLDTHPANNTNSEKSALPVIGIRHTHIGTIGKFMATVAIFSLLTRMFDMMPTYGPDPLGIVGGSTLFPLVVVGVIFLAMALIPGLSINPTLIYRVAVPIMALGFVATVAFFGRNSSVSLLLIGIGYELFDILAWVLFAKLSKRNSLRSMFVFGFGVASMFTGMALGILIGSVLRTSMHGDATQTATLALACILALVVVGFLVLPESLITQMTMKKQSRHSSNRATIAGDSSSAPQIEEACSAVASEHGLTPRESEVLVFLAKGRTIPIIARDLQIAKGTARTHAERIYRKLDVHKQQELIDLVEQKLHTNKQESDSDA